jgi:hypothetical protein
MTAEVETTDEDRTEFARTVFDRVEEMAAEEHRRLEVERRARLRRQGVDPDGPVGKTVLAMLRRHDEVEAKVLHSWLLYGEVFISGDEVIGPKRIFQRSDGSFEVRA